MFVHRRRISRFFSRRAQIELTRARNRRKALYRNYWYNKTSRYSHREQRRDLVERNKPRDRSRSLVMKSSQKVRISIVVPVHEHREKWQARPEWRKPDSEWETPSDVNFDLSYLTRRICKCFSKKRGITSVPLRKIRYRLPIPIRKLREIAPLFVGSWNHVAMLLLRTRARNEFSDDLTGEILLTRAIREIGLSR